jgi:hypothetical protein
MDKREQHIVKYMELENLAIDLINEVIERLSTTQKQKQNRDNLKEYMLSKFMDNSTDIINTTYDDYDLLASNY